MMDLITINDLTIETTIGVFDWEQQIRQDVIIDLVYPVNCGQAAETDELIPQQDYGQICQGLTTLVEGSKVKLLETLAEKIAAFLQSEYQLPWFRLSLQKPGAVKNAKKISLTIERGHRSN